MPWCVQGEKGKTDPGECGGEEGGHWEAREQAGCRASRWEGPPSW